jgi:negative regulator of sigma-B (phosphoserine phosphatase)
VLIVSVERANMMHKNGIAPPEQSSSGRVHVALLCSPMPGEYENGDATLVRHSDDGQSTILAVIDGLGHGPDAAVAARAAIELLAAVPFSTTVGDAMQAVHRALRGTRGAAGTVCFIKNLELEICAVGNVGLMCVNCTVPLVVSAGVLGHQVAKFRVCTCTLAPRARVALLSDGISTRFRLEELKHLDASQTCQFIMDRYRRKEDDATILVADVRAAPDVR